MRSRWRAPLITLVVIVAVVAGGAHFLAFGSIKDALISMHGGGHGGGGGALAGLHGSAQPSRADATVPAHPIGLLVEAVGTDHKTFTIAEVTADSPAAEAGLLKGDVITSVDGEPASGLTIAQMRERFGQPKRCALGVLRDGKALTMTLEPGTGE